MHRAALLRPPSQKLSGRPAVLSPRKLAPSSLRCPPRGVGYLDDREEPSRSCTPVPLAECGGPKDAEYRVPMRGRRGVMLSEFPTLLLNVTEPGVGCFRYEVSREGLPGKGFRGERRESVQGISRWTPYDEQG
mmetsp:Transcript_8519/g.21972  ORF Transcript_8519/g.21972 Transcript_8519/m.21972 type:complete len:133 (+) Transcript_8519:118-516(+)